MRGYTRLTLAVLATLAAFAMDIEKEQIYENPYSDIKPKAQMVCTIDLSDGHKWKDEEYGKLITHMRVSEIDTNIEQAFKKLNFIALSGHYGFSDNQTNRIFGTIVAGKIKECFIINIEYSHRFIRPVFAETLSHYVFARTKAVQNWYMRPQTYDSVPSVLDTAIEMSWKWVDIALHQINRYGYYLNVNDPAKILCERLYKRIRRKGLENSLSRIAVKVNEKNHYIFYSVYDTNEQDANATKILLELKSVMF